MANVQGPPAVSPVTTDSIPAIGRGFRLQWEKAQNAHVLLYAEGMVTLNGSAGAILSRCDGKKSVTEIVAELQQAYHQPDLGGDVLAFFRIAVENKWVQLQ